MWNNKKNLLQDAHDEIAEAREAFEWAFRTAKRILRLKVPIELSWEDVALDEELERHNHDLNVCRITFGKKHKYELKFLDKTFHVNNKEDRARISGFLEHYEMLEEAKKEKEAREKRKAEDSRSEA